MAGLCTRIEAGRRSSLLQMEIWTMTWNRQVRGIAFAGLSIILTGTACGGCGQDPVTTDEERDDTIENSSYVLTGALLDGETGEPLTNAAIDAYTANTSLTTTLSDQGVFTVGPIPASAGYRVSVDVEGYRAFRFAGEAFAVLEPAQRASVIRDVYMYKEDAQIPEISVQLVSSSDAPISEDGVLYLSPRDAGLDPAFQSGLEQDQLGVRVIGARRQPYGSSLPNDEDAGTAALTFPIQGGAASIPAGALTNGVTYSAVLSGFETIAPFSAAFTATQDTTQITIMATPVFTPPAERSDAQGDETTRQFVGRVYNGVTLERLTEYQISLEFADQIIEGQVDANGRYVLGDLSSGADYTIAIRAQGFRSFLSHNPLIASDSGGHISYYYDAFVYPTDAVVGAVDFEVRLADGAAAPGGFVRFVPSSASTLFDAQDETPAGVGRQVWENDEDLQQRALTIPIVDGYASIEQGAAVLGVTYTPTIFGVPEHQITTMSPWRAGLDAGQVYVLDRETAQPLELLYNSTLETPLSPDGSVTLRFNGDISLAQEVSEENMFYALNDAFYISSYDDDGDGVRNTLKTYQNMSPADYRGVRVSVQADTLELTWDRSVGLETADPDDAVYSISYGSLNSIRIVSSEPGSRSQRLSDLLNTSRLDVQLTPY